MLGDAQTRMRCRRTAVAHADRRRVGPSGLAVAGGRTGCAARAGCRQIRRAAGATPRTAQRRQCSRATGAGCRMPRRPTRWRRPAFVAVDEAPQPDRFRAASPGSAISPIPPARAWTGCCRCCWMPRRPRRNRTPCCAACCPCCTLLRRARVTSPCSTSNRPRCGAWSRRWRAARCWANASPRIRCCWTELLDVRVGGDLPDRMACTRPVARRCARRLQKPRCRRSARPGMR